ncbi:MAG: D-cysteine desulfhydrase family protein [Fimbriimonadaceae bacterium]|nr:D-cysteine desulfhydrase family protein [Fimbriimonadaceae bacterium]
MAAPNRHPLCCLPTPLHPLRRLSRSLGAEIWIKRDDLTGFAGGGNKGRKLEYLAGSLLESGAHTMVVCGALQSNFVRCAGALAATLGIRCVAVVMVLPFEGEVGRPAGHPPQTGGNVELDRILSVELEVIPDGPWEALFEAASDAAQRERELGRSVFEIPIGGSSPLGAHGFVLAGEEVSEEFDHIVVPTSSGSTHAGLAWHFHGSQTQVHGIACDPEPDLLDDVLRLCSGLDELHGIGKQIRANDLRLHPDWVGPGYGIPSELGQTALRRLAREEGVFLDPIYSAKAMSGLVGLAERGELAGRVLFWHTGGFATVCAPGAGDTG